METRLYERNRSMLEAMSDASTRDCRQLMEETEEDETALRLAAARWAELDPAGLLAYLEGDGRRFYRNEIVIHELFSAWGRTDPEGAYAAIGLFPVAEARDHYIRTLANNLLYSAPDKAMELVARADSVGVWLTSTYADWSDSDPHQAAQLILDLPRSNYKHSAAARLAERWGKEDPVAAAKFARQLGPIYRESALEYIVKGWMKKDLDAATEYVSGEKGGSLARLGEPLAEELAAQDPVRARKWIDEHLEGQARAKAIAAAVAGGAQEHPEAVWEIVADLPSGSLKQDALAAVGKSMANRDAAATETWFRKLAPGFEQRAALSGIRKASIPARRKQELLDSLTP